MQIIFFYAFTKDYKSPYFFHTSDIYFEKLFVMVSCVCELFRLLFTII